MILKDYHLFATAEKKTPSSSIFNKKYMKIHHQLVDTVDRTNPAPVDMVSIPIIYRVLAPSQVVIAGFLPSTV